MPEAPAAILDREVTLKMEASCRRRWSRKTEGDGIPDDLVEPAQ